MVVQPLVALLEAEKPESFRTWPTAANRRPSSRGSKSLRAKLVGKSCGGSGEAVRPDMRMRRRTQLRRKLKKRWGRRSADSMLGLWIAMALYSTRYFAQSLTCLLLASLLSAKCSTIVLCEEERRDRLKSGWKDELKESR